MATNDVDYIDDEEQDDEKDSLFIIFVYWILELIFFSKGH
jgi:hypothetical protein